MSDYIPVFTPAQAVTYTASATITGGGPVEITGSGTVGPAAATSTKYVGVAGFDAISGSRVTVWPPDAVHEVLASANVTAGDPLKCSGTAQVAGYVQGTDAVAAFIGTAITTASSGSLVRYQGR